MSKVVRNTTFPAVSERIERVLETYADYPFQHAFANPDNRQQLIAFVLNRTQNIYVAIDENDSLSHVDSTSLCPEVRLQIDAIIHQGIHCVLEQCCDAPEYQFADKEDSGLVASHWFG